MPTQPVRILKIDKKEPRFILHKANYFGSYLKAVFVKNQDKEGEESKKTRTKTNRPKKKSETKELKKLYNGKLPLKPAKLKDLLHLKQFLTNPNSQAFYEALIPDHELHEGDDNDIEYADDPPIDDAP